MSELDEANAAVAGLKRALDHAEELIEDRDQRLHDLAAELLELRAAHAQCSAKGEER